MKKIILFPVFMGLFFGGALILMNGCSTQKDALPNKLYHQLNTKYNGLFYAKEHLYSGIERVKKSHKDNYKEIIKINMFGDFVGAKSAQASFDNAIEKSTKAIQQHSMNIDGVEKNKFIDDNYIVIMVAQFYKKDYSATIKTATKILRKSIHPEIQSEALIWATRANQEIGNTEVVKNSIVLMEQDHFLNKKQDAALDEIQAEVAIEEGYYAEAIYHIKRAVKKTKDKNKKTRMYYILGQLNLLLDEPNMDAAQNNFLEVIKQNPEYEMVFNAKLNRTKAYIPNQKNFNTLTEDLDDMLRDTKNNEYRDQIYFALAGIQLKNNDTIAAVQSLQKSSKNSIGNTFQNTETHYLLAKLFWDKKKYISAYNHCDTAYQLIDNKSHRYLQIKKMRRTSKKLSKYYRLINNGDSLLALANLTENERNARIDAHIKKLKEQEQKSKKESQGSGNFNQYEQNKQNENTINLTSGGGWYFYNPSAISLGYSEFLSRWGNRKLEDNWRRKNKTQNIDGDEPITEDSGPSETEKYNRDYYLSKLPLTQEKRDTLLSEIESAHYDLAGVFKDDIEDYDQSYAVYSQLLERFPQTTYRPIAYFEIYTMKTLQQDTLAARTYLEKITLEYPNSDYLKILRGESFVDEEQRAQKKTYKRAHDLYLEFSQESCEELNKISDTLSDSEYETQLEIMTLFCGAKNLEKGDFINDLDQIKNRSKNTNIIQALDSMLLILRGELFFDKKSIYKNEPLSKHLFFIAIDNIQLNLPETQSAISQFNNQNHKLDSLKITNLLLNKSLQLLKVEAFENKSLAMAYYQLIQEHSLTESIFQNNGARPMVITKNNLNTLLKDKNINTYQRYFNEIYLLN